MPKQLADAMKAVQKLHTQLMHHRDAGPFLEPVDWKAWNLPDYPLIIKRPMDLGQIKYARDVRLVWRNCMTYNKEGSDYYSLAQKLAKHFDDKFSKIKWSASGVTPTRPPTLAEKRTFSQNMYQVGSTTLGNVISTLDSQCPACVRKINADDVEINVDTIDARTFWEVSAIVRASLKRKETGAGPSNGESSGGKSRKRARR